MDQSTDSAVRNANSVNSSSVVTPWLVLLRPQRNAAASTRPAAITIAISVTVVRGSSVPPSAPKAMPVRAAPRISGSALAAAAEERNTRGRDLRHERHPGERRHPLAERAEAACQREQAEQYQRQEERQRHLVRRTAEIEEPAA